MAAPIKPKGAKSDKWWRKAIERAVNDEYQDPTNPAQKVRALRIIAVRLVKDAMEGNLEAMKEIGNRLDGKASQSIEATVSDVTPFEQLPEEERERRLRFVQEHLMRLSAGDKPDDEPTRH